MSVTFPEAFLWGAAAAAHQIEGGNWNNDWWAFEHQPGTPCVEPSGDCCDSYHRYAEDIALVRELGLGAYRFSIEWSRIEPEDGEFSRAALDYYRRVLAECHEQGVKPVVTFHHFSTPRWMAALGGWESNEVVDRFARFCERAVAHLGDLIAMGCTINEPNIVSLMGYVVSVFPPGRRDLDAFAKVNEHLKAAHRRSYDVLKAGPGDFPVGLCVAMGDWWAPPGAEETLERVRHMHEGQFLECAKGDDFVGVQAYSRTRLDERGLPLGPEEGVEVVASMGYEYWPQALEVAVRHAAEIAQTALYVTENGLGHDNDERRIAYVRDALEGVGRCLDDGLDVRGYFYWSLLDNFEWALGYGPKFGLVEVDRRTFARTPKPSAKWFGGIARANRLD
ncbi:MAG TPA: glycoside hydrolase family 1 protein [Acidimicrobiia bacterium]|jgi:beta-glucosidase|nr:glycoside hydrolase family 1 protein [Acidimicrobiia bacterium]